MRMTFILRLIHKWDPKSVKPLLHRYITNLAPHSSKTGCNRGSRTLPTPLLPHVNNITPPHMVVGLLFIESVV